jgi:hypothetical protein
MATNNLRLGSETPSNFYVGSEAVSRIYFGSELVYDPSAVFGAPDFTSTTTGFIAPGTLYQAAHGLSSTPDLVLVEFVCLVANNGWAVGDTVPWHGLTIDQNIGSIGEGGEIIGRNSTNVFCQTGANYSAMPSKGGSPVGTYSTGSWGLRFKVWENVEKVVSSDLGAAVGDTAYTFAHGLGAGTYYVTTEYTCVIAEDGYSVGDIIENQSYIINSGNGTDVSRSHSVGYNDTDAWDLIASANYLNKGTGQNAGAPTDANWEMRIVVFDLGTPDFQSSDLSWALASITTAAHSLSTINYMMGELVCTNTPDDNWAIGDKMHINHQAWDRAGDDNNSRGSTVGYDLLNCFFSMPATYNMINLDKNTPTGTTGAVMNPARWRMRFSVWGDTTLSWYVPAASYNSVTDTAFSLFGVSNGNPSCFIWSADGTKVYSCLTLNGRIYEADASTAFDLSSLTYNSANFLNSEDTNVQGIFFKDDGTKLYTIGINTDAVYQYTLSTPWDITSASYDSVSFSVAAQATIGTDLFIGNSGSTMFVADLSTDTVYQYDLSTPWDMSTASYSGNSFSVQTEEDQLRGIYFRPEGTRFFVVGGDGGQNVHQYEVGTAWDLSTASYENAFFDTTGNSSPTTINSISFNSTGTKFYLSDQADDDYFEHDIP